MFILADTTRHYYTHPLTRFRGITASKQEQLKLIRDVTYKAPSGLFDDAAEEKPGPMSLLETEDVESRMGGFQPLCLMHFP